MAAVSQTWVRNDTVLWREVADGVLLLAPGEREPVLLSHSGAVLWERLLEPQAEEELVAWLSVEYGQPPHVVQADLSTALRDLAGRGLIRGDA